MRDHPYWRWLQRTVYVAWQRHTCFYFEWDHRLEYVEVLQPMLSSVSHVLLHKLRYFYTVNIVELGNSANLSVLWISSWNTSGAALIPRVSSQDSLKLWYRRYLFLAQIYQNPSWYSHASCWACCGAVLHLVFIWVIWGLGQHDWFDRELCWLWPCLHTWEFCLDWLLDAACWSVDMIYDLELF